jgi:hypothetical protein
VKTLRLNVPVKISVQQSRAFGKFCGKSRFIDRSGQLVFVNFIQKDSIFKNRMVSPKKMF